MKRNATFDESGKYRYTLERTWDGQRERVLFIMLNPSDADEKKDDATIRKCIGFAKCWGYGGLMAGNLFAWVSTDPKGLIEQLAPVGPENDAHLQRLAEEYGTVVVAWGKQSQEISTVPRTPEVSQGTASREDAMLRRERRWNSETPWKTGIYAPTQAIRRLTPRGHQYEHSLRLSRCEGSRPPSSQIPPRGGVNRPPNNGRLGRAVQGTLHGG